MDVAAPDTGRTEARSGLRNKLDRATQKHIMVGHIRNKLAQPRCAERLGMICARTNEIVHGEFNHLTQ